MFDYINFANHGHRYALAMRGSFPFVHKGQWKEVSDFEGRLALECYASTARPEKLRRFWADVVSFDRSSGCHRADHDILDHLLSELGPTGSLVVYRCVEEPAPAYPSRKSVSSESGVGPRSVSGIPHPSVTEDAAEKKKTTGAWVDTHRKDLELALDAQQEMLKAKQKELALWDDAAKANMKKWFGTADATTRQIIQQRIDNMLKLSTSFTLDQFKTATPSQQNRFAYVYPSDPDHNIYVDKAFESSALRGPDSKAGALCHEMSHFDDVGGTRDHVYGPENSRLLAQTKPSLAIQNADNFEYYLEGVQ